MVYIGIDPAAAKETAVAIVRPEGPPVLFLVNTFCAIDLFQKLETVGLGDSEITLVIEAQQIYRGSRVKTQTLLELANRSGFFEGLLLARLNVVKVYRPLPREWKGQVSADMYRKRILKKHPQVAKATLNCTTQEQEDLCHAYGLAIWKK